jgi:hypothetical protein
MRTWTEIIKPYSDLAKGKAYTVRVKNIHKATTAEAMEVTVEFVEPSQQGRRFTVHLSLPIRPQGLTADFFAACGIDITPQAKITPRSALGCLIQVVFEKTPDGPAWQPIEFQPFSQGESHEPI